MEPIIITIPTLPLMILMAIVGIGLTISAVRDELRDNRKLRPTQILARESADQYAYRMRHRLSGDPVWSETPPEWMFHDLP